jgi:hypothetical protein
MVSGLVHPSTLPDDGQWTFGQFPAVAAPRVPWLRGPRGLFVGKKEPGRRAIIIAGLFGALPLSNYDILSILLLPYYLTWLFTPS